MEIKRLLSNEKEALDSFSKSIKEQLGDNLLEVKFYGSKVRGTADQESDIDVFILVKVKDISTHNLIIEAALNTDLRYNVNISPVIFSQEQYEKNSRCRTQFIQNLEREGVLL